MAFVDVHAHLIHEQFAGEENAVTERAKEAGLETCAQEAWSNKAETVRTFLNPPDEWMLFCGMAIGHANPDAPVNELVTERDALSNWATFVK